VTTTALPFIAQDRNVIYQYNWTTKGFGCPQPPFMIVCCISQQKLSFIRKDI